MSVLPTMGGGSWPLKFPPPILSHLKSGGSQSGQLLNGFVSEDCMISVVFSGSRVEVLNTSNGERLATWTFTPLSNHDRQRKNEDGSMSTTACEITCCVDMSNIDGTRITSLRDKSLDGRYLCIGLSDGRVCLFNVFSSKIVRCINLVSRITSLQCLSSPTSVPRYLCEELLLFSGLVAIGTQEGHVFLVDFAIDEEQHDSVSDESSPSQPMFIDLKGGTERVAQQRATALQRGQHLCVPLQDQSLAKKRSKVFSFVDGNSGETVHFPNMGVVVSGLCFIPQIGGLLVGYNFGAWQFWNVSAVNSGGVPVSLEYSSAYVQDALPVVGFCFQEPENDPKNFVYVWVLRSENDLDSQEEKDALSNLASISLFALTFQSKDENDAGVLYSGITSCRQRFQHRLDASNSEDCVKGSLCLAGRTLPLSSPGHVAQSAVNKDLSEIEDGQLNLGLSTFLWEVVRPHDGNNEEPKFFLGIFDLNAWYQAQMPDIVEVDMSSQCPYFNICSLDETFIMEEQDSGNLIDCRIDLTTVSRYKTSSNVEQHFYPSSLAFNLVCLLDFGLVHAAHLGLQRKVLLEMRSIGKDALVDPKRLHSVCVVAGLAEDIFEQEDEAKSIEQQRCALLTVALDHHLIDFLRGCLIHWSDGKYTDAGCTMQFFIDWSWNRVASIKQSIDKETMTLFDYTAQEAPDVICTTLTSHCRQLQHLKVLFEEAGNLANYSWRYGSVRDTIESKCGIIDLVKMYADAILWFLNAGLLPEGASICFDDFFPARDLESLYASKRKRLQFKISQWLNSNNFRAEEIGPVGLLADELCQMLGPQLKANFEREGGKGLFPPPSLHALLVCFLIESKESTSNTMLKHRIVQYLFLDMASCLSKKETHSEEENRIVDNLIKYPSAFNVPPSFIKLTQAYWLLDNEDFEEAVAMLLDPLVHTCDISDEEHRCIMISLLTQGHPKLALRYCNIRKPPMRRVPDIQLHIAILLANGMIQEAFQLMRLKRSQSGCEELFTFFLVNAEKLDKLELILQLNLTLQEDQYLTRFLKQSPLQSSQEILLEYFLQRTRYHEATQLNEQLKSTFPRGGQTRQAIIDRYAKLIPSILKKDEASRSWTRPSILPEPTRIDLKDHLAMTPMFRATAMESRQDHVTQSWLPSQTAVTPFRSKAQRGVGLFQGQIVKKFQELPDSPQKLGKTELNQSVLSVAPSSELLSTPMIKKKNTSILKSAASSTNDGSRCHTPQSILKVKKMLQNEDENNGSFSTKTDETEDDENIPPPRSDSRVSRESTPGKSLRFNVPKKLPPIDLEDTKSSDSSDLEILSESPKVEKAASFVAPSFEDKDNSDREIEAIVEVDEEQPLEDQRVEVAEDVLDEAKANEDVEPSEEEDMEYESLDSTREDVSNEEETTTGFGVYGDEEVHEEGNMTLAMTPSSRKSLVAELCIKTEDSFVEEEVEATESQESDSQIEAVGNATIALTPSSRKSLVADLLTKAEDESLSKDAPEVVEEVESDQEPQPEANATIALTPSSRKTLIADLCPSEPDENVVQEEPSNENEIGPIEQVNATIASSPSTRKSVVVQLLAEDEQGELSFSEDDEEKVNVIFDFRQPDDQTKAKSLTATPPTSAVASTSKYSFADPIVASPTLTKRSIKISQKMKDAIETEKMLKKSPEKLTKFLEREGSASPSPQKAPSEAKEQELVTKSPEKSEEAEASAHEPDMVLQISDHEDTEDGEIDSVEAELTVAMTPGTRKSMIAGLIESEGSPVSENMSEDHEMQAEPVEEKEEIAQEVIEKGEAKVQGEKGTEEVADPELVTPLRRSRRDSQSNKDASEPVNEAVTPPKRGRKASQTSKAKEQEESSPAKAKGTETPLRRSRRASQASKTEDKEPALTKDKEVETPLRRSRRVSQTSIVDETETAVSKAKETPSRRGRRGSQSSNVDETESIQTKAKEPKTPLRRGRRGSQTSNVDEGESISTKAATDSETPLRRSRRGSQHSTDEEEPPKATDMETPLRRSRRVSQSSDDGVTSSKVSRASTPRSSGRKAKKNAKAIEMEPLLEEDAEEVQEPPEEVVAAATKSGRKRRLSEAPKLDIIPEETSDIKVSPRKSKRKSVSAAAVMQRTPGKRSTRTSTVEPPVDVEIDEEPPMTSIPEEEELPSTSKAATPPKRGRPKKKSVSTSAVPPKTPPKTESSRVTRSRSQSTKVIDDLFTPVKVQASKKKDEESAAARRSKRYAVNVPKKSHKI